LLLWGKGVSLGAIHLNQWLSKALLDWNESMSAFYWSELRLIGIPSSAVPLGNGSFSVCESLESVTFESGSRLERIDRSAFSHIRVNLRLVTDSLAESLARQAKSCDSF
jgi:hypothetical protein